MTQIVDHDQNMDTMGETPKPNLKIENLLSQLDFIDTASVIHAASEALRHSCGFARCYADLGINIALLHSNEEDCDWMREDIADIRDTRGLVNLITMASFRLQTLSKWAYMTINTNEQDSTSTVRIMPPRKVWEPVYIRLEKLESIREISEIKKQRSDHQSKSTAFFHQV